MRLGVNAPVQGYTPRGRATAEAFGPGVMVWLPAEEPANAMQYPDCIHFLRLDNWVKGESPGSYLSNVSGRIAQWRDVPNLMVIPGNEPDIEAGHYGEDLRQYADAIRAAHNDVIVTNVPLSVENTEHTTVDGADVLVCHSYFERQHPEDMGNPMFGGSYLHLLDKTYGRTLYVTEFNVVQTNCPIDWPDRNRQAAHWIADAEAHIDGAAFFIADAESGLRWASFDVGPEAAAEIVGLLPTAVPYLRFRPLAWEQYSEIVRHASFPDVPEPMLNLPDYRSLIAVMREAQIDPRLPLAFTWAEGHDGTDPGLVAAPYNNLGGVKWAHQPDAYDTGIAADTGGTYAGFADLTGYWRAWARTMENDIIGPDFRSGNLIAAVEHYTNGPGTGHNKVEKYGEYVAAYPPDNTPPPPDPPPPTVGVTGDDIIDLLRRYIGQTSSDGTLDPWNRPHLWGGWCEALGEGVPFHLGLEIVHRGSALMKGDAVQEQGLAQYAWPPEHGAYVFYGRDFDKEGHITFWDADQGATLGTLEDPSSIGYHLAEGAWRSRVRFWCRVPGVLAARRAGPPVVVPPANLVIPGNPYNAGLLPPNELGVGGAIRTFWESLANPFAVLGFPMGNEVQANVTDLDKSVRQRTVQKFERSWVIHQPEAPEGWRVVLALLNQKIAVIK